MSGLNFLSQDHSVPFLSFCVVFLSQEYVLEFPRWNQTCCAACSGILGHSTCTLFFRERLDCQVRFLEGAEHLWY